MELRRRDLLTTVAGAVVTTAGCSSGDGAGGDTETATRTATAERATPTPTAADEPTTATATDATGSATPTETAGDGTATPGGTATRTATATSGGAPASVRIANFAFDPVRLSVSPGTTVRWTNRDAASHDVTSGQFGDAATQWKYASGTLGQGDTASHTFESAGVYQYYCSIHGRGSMCGVVLVGDVSLDASMPCE